MCGDLMSYLEDNRAREAADPALADVEKELQTRMQLEARLRIDQLRAEQRRAPLEDGDIDDLDDDDFDVEVEHRS
jgi:GTP-binding protein